MNPALIQALLRARMTGQPVPIAVGGMTFVAHPNGMLGTPGGRGFGGQPPQAQMQQPQLPVPPLPPANALASPPAATMQPVAPSAPLTTAGVQGLPGSPSGAPQYTSTLPTPPVPPSWAQPQMPPDVTVTARRYRAAHGMTANDDAQTDMLNRLSLAAAQQGRNYWPPQQFAGPAFVAPNMLTMPPVQPLMLGQTSAQPTNVNFLAANQPQVQQ